MRIYLKLLALACGGTVFVGTLSGAPAATAEAHSDSAFALLQSLPKRTASNESMPPAAFRYPIDADHDCQNTRAEVLTKWSRSRTGGCRVSRGSWTSFYDGTRHSKASDLEVGRIVPAIEAWRSGARLWSTRERESFANDIGYKWSLVPVSSGWGARRHSLDPAGWLPPKNRCEYAKAWIGVKWRWRLSVDAAEQAALARTLSTCIDQTMTRPPARAARNGMPKGDLPHWQQIIAQDFTRNASLGTFAEKYPNWAQYDSGRDSSWDHGRPAAQQGVYRSETTTSVHDGLFDCFVHTEGVQPQVCAVTPTPNTAWFRGQMYGRYSVRFRTDRVPGYKIAWLLWPSTNKWSDGEIDFPEADLGGEMSAAAHDVTGDPSRNAFITRTGVTTNGWHTATIEWSPGRIRYLLDGRSWSTSDPTALPTGAMRWALQAETLLERSAPARSSAGHILIDWLTAYRYVP